MTDPHNQLSVNCERLSLSDLLSLNTDSVSVSCAVSEYGVPCLQGQYSDLQCAQLRRIHIGQLREEGNGGLHPQRAR